MMIAIILLLAIFKTVISSQVCQTPNSENGTCVLLDQCPQLNYLFKTNLTSDQIGFLQKSHCGFHKKTPKVCCGNKIFKSRSTVASNLLPDETSCGLQITSKIIGGERTELDEFPWMALLQYEHLDGKRTFECGGSLISRRYVLTAAHCILPSLISVRLGEYNIDTNPDCIVNTYGKDCASTPQDYTIEKTIIYHAYHNEDLNHYHDIALIRLKKDVEFNDFIKPICLPLNPDETNSTYEGQLLTVSGWGLTEKDMKSSVKLKVDVPVRNLEECDKAYKDKSQNELQVSSNQICAGGVKGKDSCKGDSGGPLMDFKTSKNNEVYFRVVGVVSFGPTPCGLENIPAVYTKVAKYVPWILHSIKP